MTVSEGDVPGSVAPQKLAAQVARQLENEIMDREWPIGEVLGSETELQARFKVSRSILREAIRLLEHQQVARMRRGPGGGLVVSAPDTSLPIRALVIYLEYIGVSVEDLGRARMLLEPLAARLAAETVTESSIGALRAIVNEEHARIADSSIAAGKDFHAMLGQLSGNALLQMFTEVVTGLSTRYLRTSRRIAEGAASEARTHVANRHAEIVEAVIAGDGAAAQTRVTTHLEEVVTWMLAQKIHPTVERMRTRPVDPDPKSGDKLAEIVAGRIHNDITTEDWQVGEILGSESDLLTRYGVSRAVLRESLQILEHHSVARMRRGPGGGLVILAPDPTANIRAMALYLNYRGLSPDDLFVVHEAIALECVHTLTAGELSSDTASRLREALDLSTEQGDSGDLFHTEIAELAGNPILSLFLRITTELRARNGLSEKARSAQGASDVRDAHEKILVAVLAGDGGLAQHRMRRHLQDLATW
ncbi:FadR/GntR family transcriptional regulator [Nocardia sp. 348MFTsu5.1]|uniref:FadR/GntR family transcriptional regulator n=1 Tax=Nocardia sp. 348MFTsu5.1 TaxID=1172185 RepID=UPI00048E40E5|nr:FCD domain-containing protein [Nocardia sp. 348MFTsu5.1]